MQIIEILAFSYRKKVYFDGAIENNRIQWNLKGNQIQCKEMLKALKIPEPK